MRSQEIVNVRQEMIDALDKEPGITEVCENLADPGSRGKIRQEVRLIQEDTPSSILTQDEIIQTRIDAMLQYCGLPQ